MSDFLSYLPAEETQRVLGLGTADERANRLRQQLAYAQALRGRQSQRSSTIGGAIANGVADLTNSLLGAYQQRQAEQGLAGIDKERTAGRAALLNAYTGGMQRQQMTAPDVVAPNIGMPDATDDQRALAAALRGKQQQEAEEGVRRGTAYLGLLSGDSGVRDFSKALLSEGAGDVQAQRLQLSADRFRQQQEMERQRLAQADRRLDFQEGQSRKDREERDKAQREFQAEQRELDRQSRERAAALMAGQRQEDKTTAQTKEFGEEIVKSGAPGFYARYDVATALLAKHKGDIPGFGRIEGRLPDEAISADGRELRQAIGQLLSEYRKGQTGAGMSDAERTEYGRITGLIQTGDEQSVRQGVDALKRAIDERVRATAGAYRPEAVKAYVERVPRVGAVLAPAAPGTQSAPAPAPVVPSGAPAVLMLPDGRRVRRNADGTYSPE